MAACQTVGGLCVGPLDRIFNTRKWVVVGTASLSLSMLIVLATVPLSLTGALAALLVLSASSAYGSVLLAHIRSHFPDHLAGRGATTGNMAQLVGAAAAADADRASFRRSFRSPARTIRRSPISGSSPRWRRALALGLAVYLTSKDAKPHAGEPGDRPLLTDRVAPSRRISAGSRCAGLA